MCTIGHEKPEIFREISVIFTQIRKSQGKQIILVHILLSLIHCEAFCKVALQFAVSLCKLYHFAQCYSKTL